MRTKLEEVNATRVRKPKRARNLCFVTLTFDLVTTKINGFPLPKIHGETFLCEVLFVI